jgi:hypothetical protein
MYPVLIVDANSHFRNNMPFFSPRRFTTAVLLFFGNLPDNLFD